MERRNRAWLRSGRLRPALGALALGAASLGLAGLPGRASGQGTEVTIDVNLVGAAVTLARPVGDSTFVGIGAGLALPYASWTLSPADDEADYGEFLHAAVFARLRPTARFEMDLGARIAVSDLWLCPASDCLPVPFAGGYAEPMIRVGAVRLGFRITGGWIGETRPSSAGRTFVTAVNPLIVRWRF